jgi:protein gp37
VSAGTDIQWTATWARLTTGQITILRSLFKSAGLPLPTAGDVLVPGATFNPWIGCHKVSPACKFCYAETLAKRFPHFVYGAGKGQGLPVWGQSAPRRVTSAQNWHSILRLNKIASEAGVRIRVFCASLADVFERFDGEVIGRDGIKDLDEARRALWDLIELTPGLDWLLLSKRPENVLDMVPEDWQHTEGCLTKYHGGCAQHPTAFECDLWPRNVWIGATVEDHEHAQARLPHLLNVPAKVRFVSYEPALGPVDFRPWAHGLHWIIIGGESGSGARPFEMSLVKNVIGQGLSCALFVKQMGARPVLHGVPQTFTDPHGGDPGEWPAGMIVRQWPRSC